MENTSGKYVSKVRFVVIAICAAACAVMILSIFFFPAIKVGKARFSTYWVVTAAAAALLLGCGFVDIGSLMTDITAGSAVSPLKILILFLSTALISLYLDEAGFFVYLAGRVMKNGSGKKLFILLYAAVSVLTVFTSNDIVILTFTPFICYFCKNARLDPVPYLIAEFTAANSWSMLLLIGNPTNVYLAGIGGIEFFEYLSVMWLPTLFAGITSFSMLMILFKNKLNVAAAAPAIITEVKSRPLILIGLIHLTGCVVMLTISSYIGLEMWLIALIFAVSLTLITLVFQLGAKKKPELVVKCLKRTPWQLVPFLLSMFVIVSALGDVGVTSALGAWLTKGKLTLLNYTFASAAAANLINNIPMSVLFGAAVGSTGGGLDALLAAVIGSNLGALLTPVGALAGIMFSKIVGAGGVRLPFGRFVSYGAAVALPSLAAAAGGLYIALTVF